MSDPADRPSRSRTRRMAVGGLEWMLASRYLKMLRPRSARLFLIPAPIALVALLLEALQLAVAKFHRGAFAWSGLLSENQNLIRNWALILLVVAWVVGVLVGLIRTYSIFTSISTFGLFLGSAALVVVLSIMSGFEQDLKQKILGANAHILVTSPDRSFTDYERVAEHLRRVKGVESVTPYLSNEVMISSQANLAGVILKGIDPSTAAAVTDLSRNMEQGKLDNLLHPENVPDGGLFDEGLRSPKKDRSGDVLAPERPPAKAAPAVPPPRAGEALPPEGASDTPSRSVAGQGSAKAPPRARKVRPGVLIGRELAKNLRVFLGDEVNVISPMGDIGPTGPMPRSRPFRVVGIFYSGMYEYDTKHVYMSIPAAQKFLGMADEVTGMEVRVRAPDETGPVVASIRETLAALDPAAHYEVQDWRELNRSLFSALKIEKIAMFIALCFIILVAGFAIVANGIMLVREKERDIAMLKSMGATDRSVLKTFLFMGGYIGGIGIGIGIATGLAACLVLKYVGLTLDTDVYYIARLPVQMNVWEIAAVFAAAMSIALAATLYPALVAARLRPVEGLRYDHG